MRFSFRATFVCAASAALILGSTGVASADTVSSSSTDFEAAGSAPHGVEVTDERTIVMLVGETASVTLAYDDANGDGKEGCNLTGSDAHVDFAVVGTPGDAGPAGLSGMSESVTFDASEVDGQCSDPETMLFSAVSAGTTVFSIEATDVVSNAEEGKKGGPNTGVTLESFDATAAGFTVVVVAPEGRDAPAIANDYLHNDADETTLAACEAANATNVNGQNWQGQLVNKIAQFFEGETFTEDEEYIVIAKVREYCGLSTTGS